MWTADIANLLCSQLWQLTVLLLCVALADRFLSSRWPHLTVCLWLAVFIKALVPPFWSSWIGLFSWSEPGFSPVYGSPGLFAADGISPRTRQLLAIGIGLWASGCVVSVGVIAFRWARLLSQIDQGESRMNPETSRRIAALAKDMGLSQCPRIVFSESHGPFVMGIFRKSLCLPRSLVPAREWATLRPILVHEFVHLRRRDTLVSLLQLVVTCVWWFNPLIRWASRRMTRAIEFSVDQEVTSKFGCDARQYARALLRVLDLKSPIVPAVGSGVSSKWVTGARIQRVLRYADIPFNPSRRPRWGLTLVLLLLLAVFLPGRPLTELAPACTQGSSPEPGSIAAWLNFSGE